MENLIIEPSKYTPSISFDAKNHLLEIKGESYPENISLFYHPVMEWLKAYLSCLGRDQSVVVNIEMIYFNSNTSKVLMELFEMFENAARKENSVVINWYYDKDNELALESGKEFKEDVLQSLTFNLIQI